MMRKTILLIGLFTLIASAAFAASGIVGKNGQTMRITPSSATSGSAFRDDFEYNTGGVVDFIPTTGGSFDGWGSHFMGFFTNNTGADLYLTEFGFPCAGLIQSGWFVEVGAMPGGFNTTFMGDFMALDPDDTVFPPTVYTYVDLAETGIVVPDGVDCYFGYINPGVGGQTDFNGVDTWAWYVGAWDPDQGWGRTAILQVKASFEDPVANQSESFGAVKALYR